MVFNLQKIPFVGKSYSDYERMFNLEFLNFLSQEKRKRIKISDGPSGASSFVTQCKLRGIEDYGYNPQYNNDNDDNDNSLIDS